MTGPFLQGRPRLRGSGRYFLTKMLTRDLFAVGNLLVAYRSRFTIRRSVCTGAVYATVP